MLRKLVIIGAAAVLTFCAPNYGVAVRNLTSQEIDDATVSFDGFTSIGGSLRPGLYKLQYDIGGPIPDEATVQWRTSDGALHNRVVEVKDKVPRDYSGRIFFEIMPDTSVRVVPRDELPPLTTSE